MRKKIRAVLFDFGGVLIDNPEPRMNEHYATALGIDKEKLRTYLSQYTTLWQSGQITESELWKKVAHEFQVLSPSSETLWLDGFKKGAVEKKLVFDMAIKLQDAGHKIGILSNTEPDVANYIREQHGANFDYLFFSCEMNVSKPCRAIYERALKEMGRDPGEVIFIDDKAENVAAAKRLGIGSFIFDTEERVIDRLRSYL